MLLAQKIDFSGSSVQYWEGRTPGGNAPVCCHREVCRLGKLGVTGFFGLAQFEDHLFQPVRVNRLLEQHIL